jgi:general nucleoside transport system permease protein
MEALLTATFLTAFVGGTITAAVPLLLVGMGEQLSEKAGVLNLGLEGMMLAGAYAGFAAALGTGSFWTGFLAGAAAGLLVAMIVGVLCVRFALNQIVVGIGITMAAQGATSLAHHIQFSASYPRMPRQPEWAIPWLADLPVLGKSLFTQHPFVYLSFAAIAAFAWLYRRTNIGLNLTAAGEQPAALDLAGVSVVATRFFAVLATGAMAGAAGAYLANVGAGLFVPFMTNGAGFMGIVLAMLARGRPSWVLAGALVVGVSSSVTTAVQVAGLQVPTDVVQMIPFALIIVFLVLFGRSARLPAALGLPYQRGVR